MCRNGLTVLCGFATIYRGVGGEEAGAGTAGNSVYMVTLVHLNNGTCASRATANAKCVWPRDLRRLCCHADDVVSLSLSLAVGQTVEASAWHCGQTLSKNTPANCQRQAKGSRQGESETGDSGKPKNR